MNGTSVPAAVVAPAQEPELQPATTVKVDPPADVTLPSAEKVAPREAPSPAVRATRPVSTRETAESRTARPGPVSNASGAADPAAVSPPLPAPATTAPQATDVAPPATPPVPVVETPPVQEPAKPRLEEVTIKEDSVVGIRLDTTVTSESARVEDRVTAVVSRDVTVDGRTAIPAGARLEGTVSAVERGGKFKERARIGVRFHMLVLGENTRVPIQTETIFRDGESPTGEAGKKIGTSAVVGAILGAVVGGKKGAVIGGTAGAAGGTAAVAASGRNEASIPAGSPLTVRLTRPVILTVEKDLGSRF
jgi:hypothetical protein